MPYSKRNTIIPKQLLYKLYKKNKQSLFEISLILNCSVHKIKYWMDKYQIKCRNRSLATYHKLNPKGDPFCLPTNPSPQLLKLKHLALGIYWGEGRKPQKSQVSIGNTDPGIIKIFQKFLLSFCQAEEHKIKYHLQTFKDMNPKTALHYWSQKLNLPMQKISTCTPIPSQGKGSYRKICKYGVMNIDFHNIKLKRYIMRQLRKYGLQPSKTYKIKVK